LRKKVLYLDQFFFSHAFRGGEQRFIDAARHIERLTSLQLLVVPYSSIHEDETHQWARRDELFKFIKATARGAEFKADYEVTHTQLLKGFKAWLEKASPQYQREERDALRDDIHGWDGYMRIEVGRYMGDIDLIRDLKRQSIEGLVDMFDGWRTSTFTFDQDVEAEFATASKAYIDFYLEFAMRIAGGDYDAIFDAPIISTAVQQMLHILPDDIPPEDSLRQCALFLVSDHFKQLPYQWLSARIFATLKAMVKGGAYTNRERALQRLSGFFYDVKHISTYAPYCDAFVMDQPMAELVASHNVGLEERFGVKVFSLNNWNDFLSWLEALEAGMSQGHRTGLATAYP
jgi:hypothetical protein